MATQEERDEMIRLQRIVESGFDGSVDMPNTPSSSIAGSYSAPYGGKDDAMKNFLKITSGIEETEIQQVAQTQPEIVNEGHIPTAISGTSDSGMLKFLKITSGLEDFSNAVENSVKKLNESDDMEIREALNTIKTDNTIKIGQWSIHIKEASSYTKRPIKNYDIVNDEGHVIVENLHVYESARGLVRLLNNNLPMNHPTAKQILNLEDKFVGLRENIYRAVQQKSKSTKMRDYARAGIYETKQEQFQEQALATKQKLIEVSQKALKMKL